MATKTEGERALADLAAGKFSFPMVDAIRDHMMTLETELLSATTELQRVNALHERAMNQLRQKEYAIGRLEGELRNLNRRVYGLLKANALTEIALRETKRGAEKFVEYVPVARKYAEDGAKMAWAYLSSLDLKGKFETLKAHPETKKALRETERLAAKFVEYLPVARRQAAEGSRKALAYLSTVGLPAAKRLMAIVVEKTSAGIADLQKKVASL